MAQIQEPPSPYAAEYPYNNVTQTESGHFQEWDDTPGAERVRMQHRSGTFFEWHPDGTEVHRIEGPGYRIVAQDDNVIIKGKCNIMIQGNAEVTVQGDAITNIQGNQNTIVEKDFNLLVKGDYNLSASGDLNFTAAGTTSAMNIQAGDRLVLDTDLTVHGQVLADDIYSDTNLTAGCGIHAGVPGSTNPVAGISTLGGVNVGIPGPTVPGTVTATVLVTAPAVIGTSVVFGGVLMDPEGGAPLIRQIYDSHAHIGNLGSPTSGPLVIMP
jgi:hypothetical protein